MMNSNLKKYKIKLYLFCIKIYVKYNKTITILNELKRRNKICEINKKEALDYKNKCKNNESNL